MDDDERIISDFLQEKGFQVKEFTKTDITESKTPDFQVFKCDELAFFCEVKTIKRDTWLEDKILDAPPLTIVGGGRNDPRFNRISNKIHLASQQFQAINPDSEYPNVLIFVNHDDQCGICDLHSVTTGQFFAEDGTSHPIYTKYSEGRIKEEKFKIHLYIWLDDFKDNGGFYLFNTADKKHLENLCSLFGKQLESIRDIREIHKKKSK